MFGGRWPPSPSLLSPGGTTPRTPRCGLRPQTPPHVRWPLATVGDTADAYSSVVSNQQNVVMKELAVISTVFLPLTFLTGFFGQNFGALVGHIGSWTTFLVFDVGTELLAVILLYLFFRSRGCGRTDPARGQGPDPAGGTNGGPASPARPAPG
jgi:hypothetical protein